TQNFAVNTDKLTEGDKRNYEAPIALDEELKKEFDLQLAPPIEIDRSEDQVGEGAERLESAVHPTFGDPAKEEMKSEGLEIDHEARNRFFEELEISLQRLREFKEYSGSRQSAKDTETKQEFNNIKEPIIEIGDSNETQLSSEELEPKSSEIANLGYPEAGVDGEDHEVDTLTKESDHFQNDHFKSIKDRRQTESIIEKFIQKDPSIPHFDPTKIDDNNEDLAERVTATPITVVSENFAKILERQMKYDKAIEIYKQLALKYPEKSTYFAALIENLKNKI
ncbi:MAG TPA: hypothetical protein VF691_11350, partial [Cytophagaceae bacterium]